MHTGSPEQLAAKERQAQAVGHQIAELLNQLEALHPGSVTAHNGRITGLAVTIHRTDSHWTAKQNR